MSIVKKFNPLKNLNQLDMLVDDFNESRHYVLTDLPESLPQGRRSFLIETGNSSPVSVKKYSISRSG